MIDTPSPNRVAAIATARIDDLIANARRILFLDTEQRDLLLVVQAYTEAKVAVLEAALKSYEPPALLTYPEPEQATLPGIAAGERPRARRVTGDQILRYLADHDDRADLSDIVSALFANHRHADQNCLSILRRLENAGRVILYVHNDRTFVVTIRNNPSSATALPPSVEEN